MSEKQACEIVYVQRGAAGGWKWRPVVSGAQGAACKETYQLFFECVLAARACGYTPPNLKCR